MSNVIGSVDGFINGELHGWIVDRDQPDSMERVMCRNLQDQVLVFRPFTFRADVATALGIPGVFGFAIPIDLLAPLGPMFAVYGRGGAPLENGAEVTVPSLLASKASSQAPAQRAHGTLHIFLHIPKVLGTSLRNTLMRTVPPGEMLVIYPGATPGISVERSHRIPLAQRDRLTWVFGHCKFGFDRTVTQPSRYVTFIREPLDRLRSNFLHHAAMGSIFMVDGIRSRPSTVFNEGLSEEFDNVMTRVLTGFGQDAVPLGEMREDHVAVALANVRRHFAFVGRHAQASKDAATLQAHLGLPPDPLRVDNVTPATLRYPPEELAAIDWDRVAARNHADMLLYSSLEQEALVSRVLSGKADLPWSGLSSS